MFSQMGFTAHVETWSLFFFPICWDFFHFWDYMFNLNRALFIYFTYQPFPLPPFLQSPRLSHLPPSPPSSPPSLYKKGKAFHGVVQSVVLTLSIFFFLFPDWISWGALTNHVLSAMILCFSISPETTESCSQTPTPPKLQDKISLSSSNCSSCTYCHSMSELIYDNMYLFRYATVIFDPLII